MKDYSKGIRTFNHFGSAYYAASLRQGSEYADEVYFGLAHPDDGTLGEMSVKWIRQGKSLVPCLHAFDDAWQVLALFPDLIQALAAFDDKNIQPTEFCAVLKACGFKDCTPRHGSPEQISLRRERIAEKLEDITNLGADDVEQINQDAKRWLAVEYNSGDPVWAMNADTLEAITKEVEQSETECEEVTVFDLDTLEEFTPILKIDSYRTNKGRTVSPNNS